MKHKASGSELLVLMTECRKNKTVDRGYIPALDFLATKTNRSEITVCVCVSVCGVILPCKTTRVSAGNIKTTSPSHSKSNFSAVEREANHHRQLDARQILSKAFVFCLIFFFYYEQGSIFPEFDTKILACDVS